MKRSTWLRISAAVTLLYAIGHTAGFPWTPVRSGNAPAVIDAMKTVSIVVGGTTRTYWDFYQGFGLAISGFLAVQAVILWQLASLARAGVQRARGITAVVLGGFIYNAVLVGLFFFVQPLVLVIALVVCLTVALVANEEHPAAGIS